MAGPKSRRSWARYKERIAKLSAAGLGPVAILEKIGLETTASNRAQVQKMRRRFAAETEPRQPDPGDNPNRMSPSAAWAGYKVTSDWRDLACVARDMAGREFENVRLRPAVTRQSAGVDDYAGSV